MEQHVPSHETTEEDPNVIGEVLPVILHAEIARGPRHGKEVPSNTSVAVARDNEHCPATPNPQHVHPGHLHHRPRVHRATATSNVTDLHTDQVAIMSITTVRRHGDRPVVTPHDQDLVNPFDIDPSPEDVTTIECVKTKIQVRTQSFKCHSLAKHQSFIFFVENRNIVYVGQLEPDLTKEQLRKKFIAYGNVNNVSLHLKDNGYVRIFSLLLPLASQISL